MNEEEFRIALDMSLFKDRVKLCMDYINDLESRTCENCKWFHEFVDGDAGYGREWVSCDEIYMEIHNFDKTKDFCSRFERNAND